MSMDERFLARASECRKVIEQVERLRPDMAFTAEGGKADVTDETLRCLREELGELEIASELFTCG
jgi:hypothetical protein